jgi:hypothetical protein
MNSNQCIDPLTVRSSDREIVQLFRLVLAVTLAINCSIRSLPQAEHL